MENTKVTSHVTKGLIISLILIVLYLVAGFAGFQFETWFTWLPTIIMCVAFIWACISYANQMNNAVTFGNVFAHGFKTSAVVACILVVYTLLAVYVIFPNMEEQAMERARQQMETSPSITEDQIDTALEISKKFFLLAAIAGSLLGTLLVGVIASLLGAAFAKKNPPTPFQQQS